MSFSLEETRGCVCETLTTPGSSSSGLLAVGTLRLIIRMMRLMVGAGKVKESPGSGQVGRN